MMDPVSAALAQRQRLEPGAFAAAWCALVGHLSIACLVLAASGRPSPAVWRVMPGIPLPVGEVAGDLTPGDIGALQVKPALVRKPASPVRAAGFPLPSAAVRDADRAVPLGTGSGIEGASSQSAAVSIGDSLGDTSSQSWYLASVRNKIWSIWVAQIRGEAPAHPEIEFIILADGSIGSVELLQSSGDRRLDMAAKRAIWAAGPFAPIPKDRGDAMRVRAVFRPSP
jgi:TonB family protein